MRAAIHLHQVARQRGNGGSGIGHLTTFFTRGGGNAHPPLRRNTPQAPKRRHPAIAAAAAVLLLAAAPDPPANPPANPPAKPLAHPARDVDVTYRIADGPRIVTERMRWLAAGQVQRLDPAGAGLFVLIDFRAHTMQTVRPAERMVLDAAAPETADAPYTRQGEDSVAGLACTDWEATATDGRPTVACITDDGVTLRASTAGRTLLTAISVDYAPQDPALFAPPQGFDMRRLDGRQ